MKDLISCIPGKTINRPKQAIIALCALLLQACVVPAYQSIDLRAAELGFVRSTLESHSFRHVSYAPPGRPAGDTVRVYIEGDGVAWQWRYFINNDPTPRRALMLDLMGLDNGNTLYVGRPCYFGLVLDEQCSADYWTFSRYSEKVVDSMTEVIAERTRQFSQVVLIGHSGGGALAMLIAERLLKTAAVVTVAGNLDIDAWVNHHSYTPLYSSINPAARAPLRQSVRQLHLLGGRDQVVPPALVYGWLGRQHAAQVWEIPENQHMCCWDKDWHKVLDWIDSAVGYRFR